MNERIRQLAEQTGMTMGQELQIVASGVGVGRSITMNEKIRLLAEQAGVDGGQTIANIICGDDEFKALGNEFNKLSQETREYIYKVIEQNQEKFARLIVGECAGIYDKIDNGNLHMGTDNYLEALHKTFRS